MRKYKDTDMQKNLPDQVWCNKCGKKLSVKDGFVREGCFHVTYSFEYFSRKDGTKHTWDLCENCYDEMLQGFVLPAEVSQETEFL